jgi:ribosomal protein L7/L12
MTLLRALLIGGLVLGMASEARAQAPDPGAFVEALIAAINGKSLERRRALVHPAALPCTRGESRAFWDETILRQARRAVPPGYTWKVTPLPGDQPLMFADQFDYPVRPTHLLQLDFPTGPTGSTALIVQLALHADGWREVAVCPKPEVVKAARAAAAARARHAEKVKTLAAGVPAPLRDAVLRLVGEGRRVEAIKHFAGATGEDLATARDVVDLLVPRDR